MKMQPEVIASIVSAVTALVAVIIGPFITLRASKNQLLGPMRQAWINDLRNAVAEFSARINLGYEAVASTFAHEDSVRHDAMTLRTQHIQSTYQLLAKIILLVNPKEPEHQELVRLAKAAYSAYESGNRADTALSALHRHTQAVLKKEWDVVKS